MLSFGAPLWLSGLLLLPVIRWLHRGGRHRRALAVSRVELWQRSAARSPAVGERQPPDPAWRRRALLAALLFVALSAPQLTERRTRITLWVDDSLSMLTREAHGTRLAEASAQARSLLAAIPDAEVDVRTLGDPWRSLGGLDDASVAAMAAEVGRKTPSAPPAALLRRDRLQWLLTDGAHASLLDWPGDARPDRVIEVAAVTRNVGLERLSARRSLGDPERYDLLLKVANGGTAPETREVVFADEAGEIGRSTVRLEPEASAFVAAAMPAARSVRAVLQPADALAEDDAIALDLRPLRRRRVAADSTCPPALLAALQAHPALAVAKADASDADAALDCGAQRAAGDVPTLRVLADRLPTRPRGLLQWSAAVPESQRFGVDPERLRVAARLRARPGDDVVLAAGDEPLLVRRAGKANVVETSVDFTAAEKSRSPEIPLLTNVMFEQLLGGELLDEVAIADRGADAARVAPSRHARALAEPARTSEARALRTVARPLLVAALLVLLWELVALGWQWRRLRDVASAS